MRARENRFGSAFWRGNHAPSGSGDTDPTAGRKPSWASWSAENSLFVTWIGRIKYCGQGNDPAGGVSELFKIQEKLYETGARNIDAPPMLRSPIGFTQKSRRRDPYRTWNMILRSDARGFADEHPDASVFIFSTWKLFSDVLDNPVAFGFQVDDPEKEGGGICMA